MPALVARTGRELQRYEDGCRLVVGYVPNFSQSSSIFFVVVVAN